MLWRRLLVHRHFVSFSKENVMGILDSFSLAGKTALLTGGAGLYGRQMTEALVEAGATTYIASRNMDKLRDVADRLGAHAIQLDLGDQASIEKCISKVVDKTGRLDILVNNAVTRCACAGGEHSLADYDASLHVNASSLFYITDLAVRDMKKRHSGSIVNIGSYMGLLGPNPVNYAGTNMGGSSPIYFYEKGGMVNYTRWAASCYGEWGIRVNCLNPGGFFNNQPEAFIKNYSANTMLGRLANDTDMKGALIFLASDASAYITGANIPVDGGYSAK